MAALIVRPAVAADVAALTDEPLPFRIKAWTGIVDGRVVGVAGLGFQPDGLVIAFAHLTDEARAHPVALHRAAVKFLAAVRGQVHRMVATSNPEFAAAGRWLERLGFTPTEMINDRQVWIWRTTSPAKR